MAHVSAKDPYGSRTNMEHGYAYDQKKSEMMKLVKEMEMSRLAKEREIEKAVTNLQGVTASNATTAAYQAPLIDSTVAKIQSTIEELEMDYQRSCEDYDELLSKHELLTSEFKQLQAAMREMVVHFRTYNVMPAECIPVIY